MPRSYFNYLVLPPCLFSRSQYYFLNPWYLETSLFIIFFLLLRKSKLQLLLYILKLLGILVFPSIANKVNNIFFLPVKYVEAVVPLLCLEIVFSCSGMPPCIAGKSQYNFLPPSGMSKLQFFQYFLSSCCVC